MAKIILLIEDDLDLQTIYSQKLEKAGYFIILALNSDQAISELSAIKPSLILLDIMLPGKMNGLELLKKIKSEDKTRDIPVIIISNLDTQNEEALKLGASGYFIKANTEFESIIEKVKEYSL